MDSLREFIPELRKHLGVYVMYRSYLELCSFISGYEACAGSTLMKSFHEWLVDRKKGRPELYWPFLVLCEIYPDGALPKLRELTDQQSAAAVDKLFDLLDEFFNDE
ncbi:hypothetical protein [Amycolatopsis sp. cmx-4-54]|uniref:hypothetical protein n=1 Tax=Amycolatopsis sp. cmx-4-54 TaxID=2790936 RepID=UPI00397B9F84